MSPAQWGHSAKVPRGERWHVGSAGLTVRGSDMATNLLRCSDRGPDGPAVSRWYALPTPLPDFREGFDQSGPDEANGHQTRGNRNDEQSSRTSVPRALF